MKRIDLASGRTERLELVPGKHVVIERRRRRENVLALRQLEGTVRVFSESDDGADTWYATPVAFADVTSGFAPEGTHFRAPQEVDPGRQRLGHGATLNAEDTGYVFLEKPEVRDLVLEAAAAQSADGAQAWADWLEAHGDPYAAPLRAMLAGEVFGRQQSWWLEGVNRGMHSLTAEFDMHDGFLRRVVLLGSTMPIDLHLLHVLSLRVAQGLEEISIDIRRYAASAYLLAFAQSSFWRTAPWPASLRVLRLSPPDPPYPGPRACAEEIGRALPRISVEP
ncbi:MAG: hypothetical protein QM820_34310 [Minicystis sp.]